MPLVVPDLPVAAELVKTALGDRFRLRDACPLPSYDLTAADHEAGRYWRGPGWINTSWLFWHGLRLHGEHRARRRPARTGCSDRVRLGGLPRVLRPAHRRRPRHRRLQLDGGPDPRPDPRRRDRGDPAGPGRGRHLPADDRVGATSRPDRTDSSSTTPATCRGWELTVHGRALRVLRSSPTVVLAPATTRGENPPFVVHRTQTPSAAGLAETLRADQLRRRRRRRYGCRCPSAADFADQFELRSAGTFDKPDAVRGVRPWTTTRWSSRTPGRASPVARWSRCPRPAGCPPTVHSGRSRCRRAAR